ncbi:MarR family winged helix-turn-helix transcriptional regulator [Gordonia westfalica]|uniref:MarR family winged helix-turn-helix transcriptional regulator n=1 Tax=Gordonia westfalica TaxID=158898 RepID=A0ABU2GV59_9ACTN|nr:MarR family winged helix-turn-helix transcriptional regulator [Gordonia westfalica]MDS1115310.1 MarR family winged helix-turn-helix transcriptional regulator [Gordonia westfalica]
MSEKTDDPAAGPPRTLTSAEAESWLNLVDGGWALFARINDEFVKRGLSLSDLRILEAISQSPKLGVSEVADTVHMRVSTVSRIIARLSEVGDVERLESKADGRHRLVHLTDQGRKTLIAHVTLRDRVIRKFVVDAMSPDEFATLGTAFRKIRAAVDAPDEESAPAS